MSTLVKKPFSSKPNKILEHLEEIKRNEENAVFTPTLALTENLKEDEKDDLLQRNMKTRSESKE